MSLKEYNKKRDFTKTKEPPGKEKSKEDNSLIFVVQKHAASRLHFDFRLEWEGSLLSWAVPKGPSFNPKDKRLAVEVEPHPYDYKDFEGTIPKGEYGGGTVMLWNEGTWEIQKGENFSDGLKKGSIKIILYGERLKGKWAMVRMKPKGDEEEKNWLLIKERDEYAQDVVGISDFNTSVRSNKNMDEISKGDDMETYEVQLATLRKKIPQGDNWIYELKYDGYRIMAYINKGEVKLESRNHKDYTEKFPDIVKELKKWDIMAVIDGEMVINKNGKSDFQALQQYIKTKKGTKPIFMAFDLIFHDGKDIRKYPLKDRKKELKILLENFRGNTIHFSNDIQGNAKELLKTVCGQNMEGLICKRADKAYYSGRNTDWIKIKCENHEDLLIIGYTQTESRIRAFSSLLLGLNKNDEIIYSGRVGTGFTGETAKEIMKKMKPLERKTPPVSDVPASRPNEEVTWLTPKLIAKVSFAEWTEDGLLRQASFKGLKENNSKVNESDEGFNLENKNAKKSKIKSKNEFVKLTSPEKEIFIDYTKSDVFNYYEKMNKKILPYIEKRLVSLFRCPGGISDTCFYQKHPTDNLAGIFSKDITESDGEKDSYMYVEDEIGLLQAVQYGTIEFHTWGSTINNLEKPDMIVFDLDPDEGMELSQVRDGVRDLKSILDELELESFLKTSGGKGYHIVVPLIPKASWEEIRDFSKNIAKVMEEKWPDKYTSNMRKEKRKGKIFIDWVRNGRGATNVCPYSIRAREPGTVSWPITWKELDKISPNEITIVKALKSRRKDPWIDFFEIEQSIK